MKIIGGGGGKNVNLHKSDFNSWTQNLVKILIKIKKRRQDDLSFLKIYEDENEGAFCQRQKDFMHDKSYRRVVF